MGDILLTQEEAANRLGISKLTLGNWLRAGKIRGAKMGRLWRITEADLQAFIEQSQSVKNRGRLLGEVTYGEMKRLMGIRNDGNTNICKKCGGRWTYDQPSSSQEFYDGALLATMLCPSGCNAPDGLKEKEQALWDEWERENEDDLQLRIEDAEIDKDDPQQVSDVREEWIKDNIDAIERYVDEGMGEWLEDVILRA